MAFGGIRAGTLVGSATSITNPIANSGSITVSIGDLLVCLVGERVAVTANVVTDNLGHTYTAQNAGTVSGNAGGRAYWVIATSAGTLTAQSATATASGDDVAIVGAAWEGPFAASPLDATPANAADTVGNYFTPLTGTLAQADELVIGWCVLSNGRTVTGVAPNTLSVSRVSNGEGGANSISAALGHQVVAATTSIQAEFGASSSNGMLGIMSFKKAASGNKTLAADSGSYAITGTAATPKLGRKTAAAAGSYAITGTAATLRRNLPLVAGAGSYAITGTASSPKHGWKLAAAAGSYAITGTNANLNKGQTLAAGAGSYAITGTAASPLHAWKLAAAAGSYAITGTVATPLHAWKLAAAAGSYSITGTAASPLHGWRVVGGAGSYAITGTAATPFITAAGHFTLVADAGAYLISGTASTLRLARKLVAESGIYLISGSDAALTLARIARLEVIATLSNSEPILDENGEPILDENFYPIFDEDAAEPYSPHPVNCMMEGYVPIGQYRTMEWSGEKVSTKATARTSGARRMSKNAPSFTSVTRKGRYFD